MKKRLFLLAVLSILLLAGCGTNDPIPSSSVGCVHEEKIIAGTPATCLQPGLTEGKECGKCGVILTAQQTIPAAGHAASAVSGTEATCTAGGFTPGVKCANCDYTTQEPIAALGHSQSSAYATDADKHWKTCSRCQAVLTDAAVHTIENGSCNVCGYGCAHEHTQWNIVLEATCSAEGKKEQKCTDCNFVIAEELLAKSGHTSQIIEAQAATCNTPGMSEGSRCGVCQTILEAPVQTPALGHSYDNDCDSACNRCSERRETAGHKDTDHNGVCDHCQISVTVTIDLYAINDLHGMFMDSDNQPGVDELTTYLKNAYKNNDNTVIFSSGDMWQGSAESGLTKGNVITEWMNALDFAFMTMGNHEFDWGEEAILANQNLAEFPFLAINIFDKETNQPVDYCEGSVMVDLGQLQIGFIGAIGDCHGSISGEYNADFYFKTGSELTELVKAEAEKLRADGAELIVYSLHDGSSGCGTELTDGYVDIVFEGHSHAEYITEDRNGVYHIQAASYNSAIAYAPVSYNLITGSYTVDPQIIYSDTYDDSTSDSIVTDLMEKYAQQTQILNDDLGRNDVYRGSTELRQLIAQFYADLAAEKWSGYDVVLGGGYLSCRTPSCLEVGQVSYADLYTLFPFDNKLALCSCSGEDLLKNYIHSTNGNYFIAFTEYGESIQDSIEPNETYYLITDAYNYTYAPNNLTLVELYDTSTYARDLLARYIQNGGMEEALEPLQGDRYYDNGTLLDYILTLPENFVTEESYYAAGVILEISNTTYGNMVIEDFSGQITLYNLYDHTTGDRYDTMENPPQVGDVILVYGTLKNYVSASGGQTPEFSRANLIRLPAGNDPSVLATIPQLIALTQSVGPGNTTQDKYCFTATITEIVSTTWGNAWLVDENGNAFYIYGMYDQDGNRYDSMGNPPNAGDTVTLYGVLKYYIDPNGNVILEMVNAQIQ